MRLSLLVSLLLSLNCFAAGKVTFIKGEVTSMRLTGKHQKPIPLKLGSPIKSGRSYYTNDLSQVVIKLPDQTWVRVGADSKFELREEKDHFEVVLYTGSLRVLFSPQILKSKTKKLIVKTEDAQVETNSAKFTVTYMPMFQHTSVYVDKGAALLSPIKSAATEIPVSIYTGEFSELIKNEPPKEAEKMTERQQFMLKNLMFAQLKEKKKDL